MLEDSGSLYSGYILWIAVQIHILFTIVQHVFFHDFSLFFYDRLLEPKGQLEQVLTSVWASGHLMTAK